MPKAGFIPNKLKPWIEARERFHLSHAQVQMARELGMNPKNLGKIANHRQEPWKLPLPQFIEFCYEKQFHRKQPQDPFHRGEGKRETCAEGHAWDRGYAPETAWVVASEPRRSDVFVVPPVPATA
jgi:hypothetical protein